MNVYTCQSCKQSKAKVNNVKSRLLPTTMLICDKCKEQGFEPRHAIIIAGRSGDDGRKAVVPYINKRLYVGEEITAAELF